MFQTQSSLCQTHVQKQMCRSKASYHQQFFKDIQKCASPSDVLGLASKFPDAPKYARSCLATMRMLTKKLSEDQKHDERRLMFEHPQFSQLCQCVMQEAKYMWRDDLACGLLAVEKLGVPPNTRLVQTLLRVCQMKKNMEPVKRQLSPARFPHLPHMKENADSHPL
ncbi:FAST kinase domain-containing protein 2, mitochondrial-like isoform X2 [Podarcis muralis]